MNFDNEKFNDLKLKVWKLNDSLSENKNTDFHFDYTLTLVFYKFISDDYELFLSNNNDISNYKFNISDTSTFNYLFTQKSNGDIYHLLNSAFEQLERDNEDLNGLFRLINFNREIFSSNMIDKKKFMFNIFEILYEIDFKSYLTSDRGCINLLISDMFNNLLEQNRNEIMPLEIRNLIVDLLKPKEHDSIYDCACGTSSLLMSVANKADSIDTYIYGQEINEKYVVYSRINMIMSGIENYDIRLGNTLQTPLHIENNKLKQFDVVVSNPPFGMNWDNESLEYRDRFEIGIPPKSKSEYAFILHMLASLKDDGNMAVVVPHGVLFREGAEGKIRKELIELNYIDSVIGLPSNLLKNTAIPVCIIIFKKNRDRKDILFIDASNNFDKNRNKNILTQETCENILECYENFIVKDKFSNLTNKGEIIANEYSLNIPMYVDTTSLAEKVNLRELDTEIKKLKGALIDKENEIEIKLQNMDYFN